jgi:hypothetical protein
LDVFDNERELFGKDVIVFTIEGTDFPLLRPASIKVPTTHFFTSVVTEDDGDVFTVIFTFTGFFPPVLELGRNDVTFLKGDIAEFGTTRTFTELEVITILEFDYFEFSVDTINTFEVTSFDTIDFDGEVVSTNMIEFSTITGRSHIHFSF